MHRCPSRVVADQLVMCTSSVNDARSRDLLDSIECTCPVLPPSDGGQAFAQGVRDCGGKAFARLQRELTS